MAEMRPSYLRIVSGRALRQAWCTVIAHSWQALVVKLVSAGLLLALAYAFVHRTAAIADDQLFSDQATIAGLAVAAAAILVFGVFLVQLLFVAPYQLWTEERERADAAHAARLPATEGADRAAQFNDAILALKHLANARELWWHHEHRSDLDSQKLPERVAEAINDIRDFFPPGASADPQEDQITRLYSATWELGSLLGFSRGETEQLAKARAEFEREMGATIQRFERQNGGREPTIIELWSKIDPLQLYQAACLWVERSPPKDETESLPPEANPMLYRLKRAVIDGLLPYHNDPEGTKAMLTRARKSMSNFSTEPITISSGVLVDRAGLRAFAETIGERPAFLFGDEK